MTPTDRRTFMTMVAGSLAAGQSKLAFAARSERIIVIGAGIMGASIAYHLAKRGAHVTILEKTRPAAGATQSSFAWINSYSKEPHSYYELNMTSVMDWRRLSLEVGPQLNVQWGGSVQWVSKDEEALTLKSQVAQRESFGDPIRLVDADTLNALLPGVVTGAVKAAAFADIEATVDPVTTTNVLLTEAQKWGAKLVYPCEVTAVESKAGKIQTILTNRGKMEADYYVLAAGVGSMDLAKQAGVRVPLINKPGILAHSKPMPRILDHVVVLPVGLGLGLKQNPDPDARVVTGGHFGNRGELEPTAELGMQMLESAAAFMPRLKDAQLDFMTLGHSVMPKDGLPIAGIDRAHTNLFVAAMDSGVTLAPLIGRLAAIEILDGVSTDILDPYRTSRFQSD